jgi:hypothetical protein
VFAVYCPRHRGRVLLFAQDIESLHNTDRGIELVYRCFCGHRGVLYTGKRRAGEEMLRVEWMPGRSAG